MELPSEEAKDEIKKIFNSLDKIKGKKAKEKFINNQEIFRESDDPAVNKLMKQIIKDYPDEVKDILGL